MNYNNLNNSNQNYYNNNSDIESVNENNNNSNRYNSNGNINGTSSYTIKLKNDGHNNNHNNHHKNKHKFHHKTMSYGGATLSQIEPPKSVIKDKDRLLLWYKNKLETLQIELNNKNNRIKTLDDSNKSLRSTLNDKDNDIKILQDNNKKLCDKLLSLQQQINNNNNKSRHNSNSTIKSKRKSVTSKRHSSFNLDSNGNIVRIEQDSDGSYDTQLNKIKNSKKRISKAKKSKMNR
mmetsp:Transcript_1732/g.2247  ORF Transcript_1732/g.2247 Transcript_1732/m.2247 type:complete len:234 (+) Transcript_1732:2-703(+)